MKAYLIAVPLLLLSAGCDRTESEIKEAIRSSLIDPDSVQFGNIVMSPNRRFACVSVNARNRMGGYTGSNQAIVAQENGVWMLLGDASEMAHRDVDQRRCQEWINRLETNGP